ncbi:FecR family protein [Echinicola sediminis]
MEINRYWNKLIGKLFNSTINDEELKSLNRWYEARHLAPPQLSTKDQQHIKEATWKTIQAEIPSKARRVVPMNQNNFPWASLSKIAACLLIAGLISLHFWMPKEHVSETVKMLTVSNQRGQVSSFTLPDSSKIWLGTGSKLSYPEKFGKTRSVTLSGEAFFDVYRNPHKPFIITTGELKTTVLGTSFNINAYPGESPKISVFTGKVEVTENASNKHKILLTQNQEASWQKGQGFSSIISFDKEEVLKWRSGILNFQNASMEEVVHEFSQWFDIEFKLINQGGKDCRFSGEFKNTSLKNALDIIQYALNIHYTINEHEVIINAKNCHTP